MQRRSRLITILQPAALLKWAAQAVKYRVGGVQRAHCVSRRTLLWNQRPKLFEPVRHNRHVRRTAGLARRQFRKDEPSVQR